MKRLRIMAMAAITSLMLAGCAVATPPGGIPPEPVSILPAPSTVADRTVLDEQGLRGLELGYKLARLAGEALVDAGLIRGETAATIARVDSRVFAALGVARSAYDAGNADSYGAALIEAQKGLEQLLGVLNGNPS